MFVCIWKSSMLANIEWNRKRAQFLIGNRASRCNAVAKHSFSLRQSRLPPFFFSPFFFYSILVELFFSIEFFFVLVVVVQPPLLSHTFSLSHSVCVLRFLLLSLLFFFSSVLLSNSASVFVFVQPASSTFDKRVCAWWACAFFKWFHFAFDAFVLAYYLSDLSMFMGMVFFSVSLFFYWIDRQKLNISFIFISQSLVSLIAMRCVFDDYFFRTSIFVWHDFMWFGARLVGLQTPYIK